ncbi:hypothetical protein TNCV_351311 [Trichonephila clavipes]|nr:hypothetical protein TNCV_351311 [Trichonephila clavipes]
MYSAFAAWRYSSRRSASPREVGRGEGRRPLTTPRCPPSKFRWKRAKSTVTCMVLKATANVIALCHNEFRGPRSGLYLSGGISDNMIRIFFKKSSLG